MSQGIVLTTQVITPVTRPGRMQVITPVTRTRRTQLFTPLARTRYIAIFFKKKDKVHINSVKLFENFYAGENTISLPIF